MPPPLRPAADSPEATRVPLCVDLDGTVILSDLLWESLALLARRSPLSLLRVPGWFLRGRALLKRRLAERVQPDPNTLPFNEPFIAWLRAEKAAGRPVLLVTASDAAPARAVVAHLNLFDEVIGSDGSVNLRGRRKAAALVARFGEGGFDYAGDSEPDTDVWPHTRGAVLVGTSPGVTRRMRASGRVLAEFPRPCGGAAPVLRALRPRRWIRNLIVLAPLLIFHPILNPRLLAPALLGFAAFCLSASSIHVIDGLLGLDADRRDPARRLRPFASGRLPLSRGFTLVPVLLAGGFLIATAVNPLFVAVLAAYVAGACACSWRFKRGPLLDAFVLAGLCALQFLAGCAAIGRGPVN